MRVVTEMAAALEQGVREYQPVVEGLDLSRETGDPNVSLKNVFRLLRRYCADSLVVGDAGTLVCFASGEQFLATGIGLHGKAETAGLCKVAAKVTCKSPKSFWRDFRVLSRTGYRGPVLYRDGEYTSV